MATDWRPMSFGRRPARSIRDPLLEPLWPGRRVLVHVGALGLGSQAAVLITDETGLELAGHPDLQGAVVAAAHAADLVLDGYLLVLPSPSAPMATDVAAAEVPGLGSSTRQLLLGSRPGRGSGPVASGPIGGVAAVGGPLAAGSGGAPPEASRLTFVAVDLLLLDGDSLLDVPLLERKRQLDSVLAVGELVRRSPHVRLPASNWYRQWRALGFREMAVKDANSRYRPGESSDDWSIAPIPHR